MAMWEIAQPRNKKFKLFIEGPPGCFKSRVALRLADNGDRAKPTNAVIDTEFGTDWYGGDFAFKRAQTNDPDEILKAVTDLVKKPGDIRTLTLDSFSVHYDALMDKWVDLFALREKTSAGNKGEYYTLQPRDYVHINRDASKLVRMMLKSDLNVICICQVKDQWEGMKVIGSVFDGWKRLPYYFDTRIQITEKKGGGWVAKVLGKDRSNSFKPGEIIPWENDEQIVKYITDKMGQSFSGGALAGNFDPETEMTQPVAAGVVVAAISEAPAAAVTPPVNPPVTPAVVTPEPAVAVAPAVEPVTIVTDERRPPFGYIPPSVAPEPVVEAAVIPEIPSGPVKHETLVEIVRVKKEAKINDPVVWGKLVAMFNKPDGTPHTSAKEMTEDVAQELIKSIIRGEIPT